MTKAITDFPQIAAPNRPRTYNTMGIGATNFLLNTSFQINIWRTIKIPPSPPMIGVDTAS